MIVSAATGSGRRILRRTAVAVLVGATAAVAATFVPAGASTAAAAPSSRWAPAASATIHPGVQTFTGSAQCTTNFVFTAGSRVFVGQAAHCAARDDDPTATNGCDTTSLPLGTKVTVTGASRPGTLAYSSWITMAKRGEQDRNACRYNDLALVELDRADVGKLNPSVPVFGGPTGIDSDGVKLGEKVFAYGNSGLRQGIGTLSPMTGLSAGDNGAGWSHLLIMTPTPLPGDSGSPYLDGRGAAIGQLSTLNLLPGPPGSAGIGDLAKELSYANRFGGLGRIVLEQGTQPFTG